MESSTATRAESQKFTNFLSWQVSWKNSFWWKLVTKNAGSIPAWGHPWGPLLPTPGKRQLSSPAKSELQWRINNVVTVYNVINHPQPQHKITTYASLTGLGGGGGGGRICRGVHRRKLVSFRVETQHQLFGNVSYIFRPPDLCKRKKQHTYKNNV